MFDTVLVANRGEIAVRVIRTLRRLGIRSIAVYSDPDATARHVLEADTAVRLGPAAARESYLAIDKVVDAAVRAGAQAIHPGYGFLSENADFAAACERAGVVFLGPPSRAIRVMGDKITAKNAVAAFDVPVVPGVAKPGLTDDELVVAAGEIGYPVLIKPSAGGGGKGMRGVGDRRAMTDAVQAARREARAAFGDGTLYVERLLARPRHVEVQVFADGHGSAVHLFERECSVQRRHQKVAEETPSPGVSASLRERMLAAAVKAGEAVGYRGAGTVECLVDADAGSFVFLEMNTRLQVEHPVTELVPGIALGEQQFLVAAGEPPSFDPGAIHPAGHALELRIYAEDPVRFLPGPGTITEWDEPAGDGVRVDAGYQAGNTVTPFYDPLLAKLCVHGADRAQALERARDAVAAFRIAGPKTNLAFHADLLASPDFVSGDYDTSLVSKLRPR